MSDTEPTEQHAGYRVTYPGPHALIDLPAAGLGAIARGETITIADEWLATHLVAQGWVPDGWEPTRAEIAAAAAGDPELEAQAEALVAGSVSDVLERVGGDTTRAKAALEVEQASEEPRVSLVKKLTAIAYQEG